MAKGESNYTTKGRSVQKTVFTPVSNGDHEAKLDASAAAVKQAAKPGSFPYVGVVFEILNSADVEGGKNKKVFHNLFCSMKPWKNGQLGPDQAHQINGLSKALGEDYDGGCIQVADENGEEFDCLNPKELLQWVKDHDGALLSLHTKIKKDPEYGDKAEIKYFIETDQADVFGAEEPVEEEAEEVEEVVVKKAAPAKKKR